MTRSSWTGMLRAMRVGHSLGVLCVCWALLGSGCTSGTETGNPSLSLSGALSYTGYSSKPTEYGVREGGSIAVVENAWLDLDAISVSPMGECGIDGGQAFLVPALGVGDHAAGQHNSTAYVAKPGSFCSVDVPFMRVASGANGGGLPDELRGNSLLIVGKLADGTPFSITSSSTPIVPLRAVDSGFALSSEQPNALIAFDFAAWLDGIDLAGAAQTGGQIVISESQNVELLAAFEANLAAGIALYRDRDGDGVMDVDAELLAITQ